MSTTTLMEASTTTASAIATCTTAIPGKYGRVPVDACNANYFFDPSFGANLAFCVLFGLTTMTHLIQAILFKKASRPIPKTSKALCLTSHRGSAGWPSWARRGKR